MKGIIYGLICPVQQEVRYVGQTSYTARERLQDHLRESFYAKDVYSHKENWIRKTHTAASPVTVVVLEEVAGSLSDIDDRERFWISQFPHLTNILEGGTSGYQFTPEIREKMATSKRGPRNPMWGTHPIFSKEQRENISSGLRKSKKFRKSRASKVYRKKISDVQSKNIWLVLDESKIEMARFRNAREVADFFSGKLGKPMTVGNIKNARRFQRPIGKQLESWFYICYERDHALPLS